MLKEVTKMFGGFTAVHAVDIEVERGEFISLLGPSGCGKTTILRMLAGFLAPDRGEIWVGNRQLSSPGRVVPPERRGMSMIFQSYAVWPHMTVFENVAYGLRLRRLPDAEVRQRVNRMLEVVKLGPLANRYPAELSGGQQQRVALARALVVEPEILLLDEPLSNLDANLREEMRFEIRRLHDEFRITTIYVTHDQAEALVTSDRIVVLNNGRVEQVGTPEEVYRRPASVFVASFLGRTNLIPGEVIGERTVGTSAGILHVHSDDNLPPPGQHVVVAVRPHDIHIIPSGASLSSFYLDGDASGPLNVFHGLVERRTYLGDAQDYAIVLGDGHLRLRVTTRPSVRFDEGETVQIAVPPSTCRVLPRGDPA